MRKILLYSIITLSVSSLSARNIEEVVAEIEQNNLELKSQEASNRTVIAEMKTQNRLEPTSIEYSPFFHKEISGVASSELIVSQEFDFPTLYSERGKAEKLQNELLISQLDVSRRKVRIDAWLNCLECIRLAESVSLLKRRLIINDSISELYDKKQKNGDATLLDVKRIELERMELNTALMRLLSEKENVVRELVMMNGGKDINIESLEYPQSMRLSSEFNNDLEIAMAEKELKMAGQNVRISKQGWLPKLSLGYRRNTESGDASNGFLIGASIPLFSNSSSVNYSKSKVAEAQIRREEITSRVKSEIDSQTQMVSTLSAAMKSFDLSLMDELVALLNKSVTLGNMSLLDYYEEVSGIYEKYQTYIDLQSDYYKALVQLNRNNI